MEITEVFASNLREARKLSGMTQQGLADMIRVNVQTIRDLEAGRRGPSMGMIGKLADAFNLGPDAFFRNNLGNSVAHIQAPVSSVLKRLERIPDDIYNLAAEIGDDQEGWEMVRVVLQRRSREIRDTRNKKQG